MRKKCVFLDRDGVVNVERGTYTYAVEDFELEYKVPETIAAIHAKGYSIIVITNQAGISKGIYTEKEVNQCHEKMLQLCPEIKAVYFSPYHNSITESLTRKPESLLFEKAIAKFGIDPSLSWMVGDRDRDLIPAKKMGMQTVIVGKAEANAADFRRDNLNGILDLI